VKISTHGPRKRSYRTARTFRKSSTHAGRAFVEAALGRYCTTDNGGVIVVGLSTNLTTRPPLFGVSSASTCKAMVCSERRPIKRIFRFVVLLRYNRSPLTRFLHVVAERLGVRLCATRTPRISPTLSPVSSPASHQRRYA
jgi:hypothetical protein